MNEFVLALIGGGMIGAAASLLLVALGRVAGISGIVGSLLSSSTTDKDWRAAFFIGLLSAGLIFSIFNPEVFGVSEQRPMWMMALAGLLVGYGTQMGSGCTSGHGICGNTRFSPRSFVATLSFMAAGMAISTILTKVLL